MGGAGRGGARAAEERCPHLLKGSVVISFWPQPYNCTSFLSVQPPLEECPRGGGTGNSHLGGSRVWPTVEEGLGLQLLPVLAIVLQLQGWGTRGLKRSPLLQNSSSWVGSLASWKPPAVERG